MRKSVITWVLFIISALILYLFSNGSVTLALLVALITALPLSYAFLRLNGKKIEMSLKENETEDNTREFILEIRNRGIIPVAAVEATAVCVNLRTGETESLEISSTLGPRKAKKVPLQIIPAHAGRYELTVSAVRIKDPLGIWSKRQSSKNTRL